MFPRLFLILFLGLPVEVFSQLRGNNLYEYQLGNVPNEEPAGLSTHYDMLNLLYTYGKLTGTVRYEQFVHPEQQKEYYRLSQYSLSYRDRGLDIKLGHFNETLGNGLLLRTFEIPSSIFEDQAFRIRQGFYRDLKGFKAGYTHKLFNIKLVRGRSLLNLIPPGYDESLRRPDLTEAIEAGTRIFSRKVGIIIMRNTNDGKSENFISFISSGKVAGDLTYSFELADRFGNNDKTWFTDETSYGIYASLNYSIGSLGISLEYKNYHDMFIGAGISDPPTLIREQAYRLLNRSTHIPELSDESGYQAEIFYGFPGGDFLTVNHSLTVNEIGNRFIFQEYFIEYQFALPSSEVLKLFADYSSEPLRLENNRYSGGIVYEPVFTGGSGMLFQFEYQYFRRRDFLDASVSNAVAVINWHRSDRLGIGISYELSTDPFMTDKASTLEIERGTRHWAGLDLSYRINKANRLTLFAGERRGGPACTSGICYEVLNFRGVELRLVTKF